MADDRGRVGYRRYRAPQQDGAALFDPAWREMPRLVEANRASHALRDLDLLGRPLEEVTREARRELLDEAHKFTSTFCDVPPPDAGAHEQPLLASGHQPELFHPGVWLKNYCLDALARRTGGSGVHLWIDSDLCRHAAVVAPTGGPLAPRAEAVAFDSPGASPGIPFEERPVYEPSQLASFGKRVSDTLVGFVEAPLAGAVATDMVQAARETGNLGHALSVARRRVEGRWGATNLELPISIVCDTDSFRRFLCQLLSDPHRLHLAYNGALAAYRTAHRLRNAAQPLPDLHVEEDWFETPLWVWTDQEPTRRPLYACARQGGLVLSDRLSDQWELPLGPDSGADDALQRLGELRRQGVKIRSRALVTTLYARLVLSDLFLHGIGGAKYDQVTDDLARRLWGAAPSPHATLTATVRLPIDRPEEMPVSDAELRGRLRDLRYHPERFLSAPTAAAERLVADKRAAVSLLKTPLNAAWRHQEIERINTALQALLVDQRREVIAQRDALAERLRVQTLLGSREYSFCLFPEDFLREQMHRLVAWD